MVRDSILTGSYHMEANLTLTQMLPAIPAYRQPNGKTILRPNEPLQIAYK